MSSQIAKVTRSLVTNSGHRHERPSWVRTLCFWFCSRVINQNAVGCCRAASAVEVKQLPLKFHTAISLFATESDVPLVRFAEATWNRLKEQRVFEYRTMDVVTTAGRPEPAACLTCGRRATHTVTQTASRSTWQTTSLPLLASFITEKSRSVSNTTSRSYFES